MSEEIKFDHFKDINELLKQIDLWYRDDDIEYTRWFGLEDLYNLKIYITFLQQKVEQLEKENQKFFEELNTCMIERNSFLDKVEQLENIRKEAIEYNYKLQENYSRGALFEDKIAVNVYKVAEENLNILNKGSDEDVNITN